MTLLKRILPLPKKQMLAETLRLSGLNSVMHRLPTWSGLLVLNYHRLGNPGSCPFEKNLFSATPEAFERQVRAYKRHADVVRIDDLEEIFHHRRAGKYLLITFDDGYRDNYEIALPVLQKEGVPATFFIATGLIDDPRVAWWDEIAWMIRNSTVNRLPASRWFPEGLDLTGDAQARAIGLAVRKYWTLQSPKTGQFLNDLASQTGAERCPKERGKELWLTWEMIQEMQAAGLDIGGHTVDHPILARESENRQRAEIAGGYQRLTEKLGSSPQAFAYPVGHPDMFTETTKSLLKETGYRYAFSFYGTYQRFYKIDPYDIPRCAIDFNLPTSIFQARLTLPQIFSRK